MHFKQVNQPLSRPHLAHLPVHNLGQVGRLVDHLINQLLYALAHLLAEPARHHIGMGYYSPGAVALGALVTLAGADPDPLAVRAPPGLQHLGNAVVVGERQDPVTLSQQALILVVITGPVGALGLLHHHGGAAALLIVMGVGQH